MTELIRIGQSFFEDLATTPEIEARLLRDGQLTEPEFATRHTDTILDHYMNAFGFDFLREDAEFFAAAMWHYLQARRLRERHQTDIEPLEGHRRSSWPGAACVWQAA